MGGGGAYNCGLITGLRKRVPLNKLRYIAVPIKILFEFTRFFKKKLQNVEFISIRGRGGLITGCIFCLKVQL